ncbi:MAG: hypothetical protein KGZ40_04855 [Clostridiales bacterium]|nr:hypothetical protein [Clostridiales bacterium]
MDTLDRRSLLALAGHAGWPAISVYLPAHRAGAETQQNPIRLKNLLKEVEAALAQGGMRAPQIDTLLSDVWKLQGDPAFWRDGFDGLAVFIGQATFTVYRTAVTLPERVRVGKHFFIRPLVPALAPHLRFIVLALSKNRVRLLEGTGEEVREIDPAGIPQGLAEALKYDDYERQVHFHSRTPAAAAGRGGKRAAMFHGHGGHADIAKESLERYFRLVDKGLVELIGTAGTPLLLAGVDYLLPIYRAVSTYRDLLPEALTGNPDETPAATLHVEALEVLSPYVRRKLEDDLASLESARENATAASTLEDVVLAAHAGRVETLFVAETDEMWGSVAPGIIEVAGSHDQARGDTDLLDRAAAQTLLHGGDVHVLAPGEAAAAIGSPAAAVLRY